MSDVADEFKYQRFTDMINKSKEVYVHLDSRSEDVVVPKQFKGRTDLILSFGLDLPVPIPDLVVNADGIAATLSFGRVPHAVKFPWSVVYALVSKDDSVLWPDSVPKIEPEVVYEAKGKHRPFGVINGGAEASDIKKPNLQVVKPENMN